jgi:hypothetical protein
MPKRILNRIENESVTVSDVQGLHGQQFKKVVMVISEGKFLSLKRGLEILAERDNTVAQDLAEMIFNASH